MIPAQLSFDRIQEFFQPWIRAERFDAPNFLPELVPGSAGGVDNAVVVGVQPMREVALLEVEPDAFDRIDLGRLSRDRQQSDVRGDFQAVGTMPSGLIGEHDGDLICRQSF